VKFVGCRYGKLTLKIRKPIISKIKAAKRLQNKANECYFFTTNESLFIVVFAFYIIILKQKYVVLNY